MAGELQTKEIETPLAAPVETKPLVVASAAPPQAAGLDGYLSRVSQIESRGNPAALNKGSGAAGEFQFIPSTWKQYGVGDPHDPAAARAAMMRFTQANKSVLESKLGRSPTDAEMYLAHQQGAGGALKLLSNPNTRAGDLVGDSAIKSNGGDPNASASAFINLWTNKYNRTQGVTTPTGSASAAPGQTPLAPPAPAAPVTPQIAAPALTPLTPQAAQPLVPKTQRDLYLALLKQPQQGAT